MLMSRLLAHARRPRAKRAWSKPRPVRDGSRLEFATLDAPVASIGGSSSVSGIADIDGDGNVDLRDYAWLQDCFDPSGLPVRPGCADADQNADGHVDGADTAALVTTLTGP